MTPWNRGLRLITSLPTWYTRGRGQVSLETRQLGIDTGSGQLIGALNALQVLKRSPRNVLSDASRTHAGRPRTRLRNSLVVSQVALAVIFLSATGLMLRTFLNLVSSDTGYEAKDVFYGVTVLPHTQ